MQRHFLTQNFNGVVIFMPMPMMLPHVVQRSREEILHDLFEKHGLGEISRGWAGYRTDCRRDPSP